MLRPAMVTAREMSANATFLPTLGVDWGVVCTGQHVQTTWSRFEPGVPYEMHEHDFEQVSVLLAGRLRLTVGELTRDIAAGDIWFAPAGVLHGGEVIGSEAAVFLDILSRVDPYRRRHAQSARPVEPSFSRRAPGSAGSICLRQITKPSFARLGRRPKLTIRRRPAMFKRARCPRSQERHHMPCRSEAAASLDIYAPPDESINEFLQALGEPD